ncbi:unnamed protein product [Sphagnum balticum]
MMMGEVIYIKPTQSIPNNSSSLSEWTECLFGLSHVDEVTRHTAVWRGDTVSCQRAQYGPVDLAHKVRILGMARREKQGFRDENLLRPVGHTYHLSISTVGALLTIYTKPASRIRCFFNRLTSHGR